MALLDQLTQMTVVVADTGDFNSIKKFKPRDATTNPSLITAAAQLPEYADVVTGALKWAEEKDPGKVIALAVDRLSVEFGLRILQIVPGRVSTEVDARLSFDTACSVAKAHRLIAMYEAAGVARERILIKLASTWEGVQAARILQHEGINCNMTLLFSFCQAVACGDAGVTLISPFVGRIYDWYKKERNVEDIAPENDPGVESVTRIYNYYKKFGYRTQVMGASFRKVEQITRLAGCDLLTISPELLDKLEAAPGELQRRLSVETAKASAADKLSLDEKAFRWMHNEDAMATDKLAEGIRKFHVDGQKLEHYVQALVEKSEAA